MPKATHLVPRSLCLPGPFSSAWYPPRLSGHLQGSRGSPFPSCERSHPLPTPAVSGPGHFSESFRATLLRKPSR